MTNIVIQITKTTPYQQKTFKIEVGDEYKVERKDYFEDKDGNRTCYLITTKTGHGVSIYKHECKIIKE